LTTDRYSITKYGMAGSAGVFSFFKSSSGPSKISLFCQSYRGGDRLFKVFAANSTNFSLESIFWCGCDFFRSGSATKIFPLRLGDDSMTFPYRDKRKVKSQRAPVVGARRENAAQWCECPP
jgi:hypothetical protein